MPANFRGPTPRNIAAAIVARKHAVPEAVSQFHSNKAAYGVFLGTTGGTCVIRLCRPGTPMRFKRAAGGGCVAGGARTESGRYGSVQTLTRALMLGAPNVKTEMTKSTYGSHAM